MANRQIREMKAAVAKALADLHQQNDGLRPSEVVAAAKPKTSPLHCEFTWDDTKAAHEYRLNEARHLIRVVTWVDKTKEGTEIPGRYVHVPEISTQERIEADTREGVYHPISVVVHRPNEFARALQALVSKVNAATDAARELRDAAGAVSEDEGDDRLLKIGMAITALETASAAVASLH